MGRSVDGRAGRAGGQLPGLPRAALALWAALILAAVAAVPARAQDEPAAERATVRVVHGVADAGPVDVYVDGVLALSGLAFPDAADPLRLAAGDRLLQVVPTGAGPDQAVAEGTVELAAGRTYLVAALGTAAAAQLVQEGIDLDPLAEERARLRVLHGSPDAGELEAAVTGDVLFPGVQFPDATDYAEVEAGSYDLEIRTPGADVPALALPGTELAAGVVHDLVVIGQTADGTLQALILTASPAAAAGDARPAWIAAGDCGEGAGEEEVVALSPVAPAGGEALGPAAAAATEGSFTVVERALDDLLAEEHAIVVAGGGPGGGALVACGEIGGAVTDEGNLVVGLREQNGSGVTGIALLAPSVADPATTDVSVYLAAGLAETGGGEATAEDAAPTDEAPDAAEPDPTAVPESSDEPDEEATAEETATPEP